MIQYSFSLQELEYYLLVLVRVTSFLFVAPFFSMSSVPARVKITFGVFVSYLIYQVTMPHVYPEYNTVVGYAIIVLKEGITGLLVGFSANICNSIVLFAGRIVDMEIGLSMANQMDPTTKENASVTGMFYQYMVLLILLLSGMHRFIIQALVETYELIPVNRMIINQEKMLDAWIQFLGDYIILGFRLCLPIFGVVLIVNVVLGILAKVSPQMNMFAVGIQIKLFVGLCVLFFSITLLPHMADLIYTQVKIVMVSFVEAMMQ